jgi:hypothetical protein
MRSTGCPQCTHPGALGTANQCRGQFPGAAHRHRETGILGEHGHDVAHDARSGRIQWDVGVHGVAHQQGSRGVAGEQFLTQHRGGQQQLVGQPQRPGRAEGTNQSHRALHGREGREQGIQHPLFDRGPFVGHP